MEFLLYVVEPPFQLVRNLEIEGENPNYKLKPRSGSVFTNSETNQAPVVQKRDSSIHRINRYRVDSAIGFPNIYPLDSDLSGG